MKFEPSSHDISLNDTHNAEVQIAPPFQMKLNFYFPRGEWEEKEQVCNLLPEIRSKTWRQLLIHALSTTTMTSTAS